MPTRVQWLGHACLRIVAKDAPARADRVREQKDAESIVHESVGSFDL